MLEIIYRIYEVVDREYFDYVGLEKEDNGIRFYDSKKEILMDCIVCDTRDQFKEIIKNRFGENIAFKYSKKLNPGDLYCIIIGEHCWNTERYFNKIEFTCDECGAKITTYLNGTNIYRISDSNIKYSLFGSECSSNGKPFREMKFCSGRCLSKYIDEEKYRLSPNSDDEFWVTKDAFTEETTSGYIYKITKKSTGEFYVGQTQYVPVFRWAQHLKTKRFPQENITDYRFEVIEIVPKGQSLLDRETYWIQECYKENPEKSLNISQISSVKKELTESEKSDKCAKLW